MTDDQQYGSAQEIMGKESGAVVYYDPEYGGIADVWVGNWTQVRSGLPRSLYGIPVGLGETLYSPGVVRGVPSKAHRQAIKAARDAMVAHEREVNDIKWTARLDEQWWACAEIATEPGGEMVALVVSHADWS